MNIYRPNEIKTRLIYKITNLINGKTYFGKLTIKTERGFLNYWGSGTLIKRAIEKYGLNNFKKEVIIRGQFNLEQINKFEKCIIKQAKLLGKAEYNLQQGGDGGSAFGMFNPNYGNYWTNEQKQHNAEITKEWNKINPWIGCKHSEESKRKMREKAKNRNTNKHWFTNGRNEVQALECPTGFKFGRLKPVKSSFKKGHKPTLGTTGLHYYNNGKIQVMKKECPEGFVKGKLKI